MTDFIDLRYFESYSLQGAPPNCLHHYIANITISNRQPLEISHCNVPIKLGWLYLYAYFTAFLTGLLNRLQFSPLYDWEKVGILSCERKLMLLWGFISWKHGTRFNRNSSSWENVNLFVNVLYMLPSNMQGSSTKVLIMRDFWYRKVDLCPLRLPYKAIMNQNIA